MITTAENPTPPLTAEQTDFLDKKGYLALESVTDAEDVASLRASYDRIFAERAGRDEGNQFDLGGTDEDGETAHLPQILKPAKYAPEMLESRLFRNVEAIGKQLLGDGCECRVAHAIYKPPHIGGETPWHQDAAYWDPTVWHKRLSVWVPLQEATTANGCMHFVPESQSLDILPHRSINNDPRIHGLELVPEELDHTKNAVACPLPPGGATLHNGYTLHYAPPNRSDIPRRALILDLGVPSVPRDKPRHFPWQEEKQTAGMERRKRSQS